MSKKEVEKQDGSRISMKDSIKTKLIAIMVLVAAIPLIVAVVVSYFTSTDKALADAKDIYEWQVWYLEERFQDALRRQCLHWQRCGRSRM